MVRYGVVFVVFFEEAKIFVVVVVVFSTVVPPESTDFSTVGVLVPPSEIFVVVVVGVGAVEAELEPLEPEPPELPEPLELPELPEELGLLELGSAIIGAFPLGGSTAWKVPAPSVALFEPPPTLAFP